NTIVDSTNPIEISALTTSLSTSNFFIESPSIISEYDFSTIVHVTALNFNITSSTSPLYHPIYTTPITAVLHSGSTLAIADRVQASAGPTGVAGWIRSGGDSWRSVSLEIRNPMDRCDPIISGHLNTDGDAIS